MKSKKEKSHNMIINLERIKHDDLLCSCTISGCLTKFVFYNDQRIYCISTQYMLSKKMQRYNVRAKDFATTILNQIGIPFYDLKSTQNFPFDTNNPPRDACVIDYTTDKKNECVRIAIPKELASDIPDTLSITTFIDTTTMSPEILLQRTENEIGDRYMIFAMATDNPSNIYFCNTPYDVCVIDFNKKAVRELKNQRISIHRAATHVLQQMDVPLTRLSRRINALFVPIKKPLEARRFVQYKVNEDTKALCTVSLPSYFTKDISEIVI